MPLKSGFVLLRFPELAPRPPTAPPQVANKARGAASTLAGGGGHDLEMMAARHPSIVA